MPRAGWLAGGALLVAVTLGASAVGPLAALGLGCLAVAAAVARTTRRPGTVAFLVGAGTVALRIGLAGILAPPASAGPLVSTWGGAWSAQVTSLGSTAGGVQRAVLLVHPADDANSPPAVTTTSPPPALALTAYATLPRYPELVIGDRIRFDGDLEPVPADGSGFSEYLVRIGAVATTRVSRMDLEDPSGGLSGSVEELRRGADLALARGLPEPEAGLASGIVVGRRDRVSRDVAADFSTTGLSHVVAISGWNIALVGAVIGGLLSGLGLPRRGRTVALLLAIAGYSLLAGGGASVIRAAVMGAVALVARETGRPGSAPAALGLAVWGLLLLDPMMAADIGFQLSVAATAGLLAWGEGVEGWLRSHLPTRAGTWLAEALGVSLAAQAATLPLVLFHFSRLSLVSPLANLVIAPLVAPAMLFAVLALLAGLGIGAGLPALLLAPLSLAGWAVLGALVMIAHTLAAVPLASVALPPPLDGLAALLSALGVASIVLRARRRQMLPGQASTTSTPAHRVVASGRAASSVPAASCGRGTSSGRGAAVGSTHGSRHHPRITRLAVAGALLGCVPLGIVLMGAVHGPGRLAVTVMDVGQGDAILIEGPTGGRILIDGGPDPDRLLAVLDGLLPAWDRRIDLVVLSHPHEDHVAGLAVLLHRYRVARISDNGMLGAGPGDGAFRQTLRDTGTRPILLAAGDRLALDGARLGVLWPLRGSVPERSPDSGKLINDTSIVFDLRYGERRMLLMGDVEEEIDPQLLAAGIAQPGDPPLDVLKVAHHGSGTATSKPYLEALHPRVALVSAGLGNPYGHPAPRTIQRLEQIGAHVLRTDLDGTLQVSTDGRDLHVATTGGRPRAASAPGTSDTRGLTANLPGGPPLTPRWIEATPTAGPSRSAAALASRGLLCAIPLPYGALAAGGAARGTGRDRVAAHPARGTLAGHRHEGEPAGSGAGCYDRWRDDPQPCPGSRDPADAVAQAAAREARVRRGRDRRVPRGACGGAGRAGRSPPGRERGAPA